MKMTWKWRRLQKLALPSKIVLPPSPPLKNYLNFFLWLLPMTATPQLMLNQKWYQASKLEMEFHIMYAASSNACTDRKDDFSCKDGCIMTKHAQRWTYSPQRLQYDLCHLIILDNRGRSFMTSATLGGGGVNQILTFAYRGERGVSQSLTFCKSTKSGLSTKMPTYNFFYYKI